MQKLDREILPLVLVAMGLIACVLCTVLVQAVVFLSLAFGSTP